MHLAAIAAKFASRRTSQTFFLHACQGWLALTAPNARHSVDAAGDQLEHVCQTAIDGRRAVRLLARWAERFQLSESELQILWCLCAVVGPGVDQTTLAAQLALSPPQVSVCVEKLRARGLIMNQEARGDRRRRLWQSSAKGNSVLEEIVQAAGASREAAA
jgi:DNA-binding MarR family transcriptional regulator